jgi:hypothetical protein
MLVCGRRKLRKLPAEYFNSLKPSLSRLAAPVLELVFILTGIPQIVDPYVG